MKNAIKKIVIVGGGSAGWLSAGIIAAEYVTDADRGIDLVLVESPDVPTLGVGEGTWPSMRESLKKIGISETQFIRECDVSFKQGSKFVNWLNNDSTAHAYCHPFTLPEGFDRINLADHWLPMRDQLAFAEAVTPQAWVADHKLAPKIISTPEYAGVLNYGYHLNAGKFTGLLQKQCVDVLGVRHILDKVLDVKRAENGDIEYLVSEANGKIDGDLFIDCSGFASLLIGEHLQVPFVSRSHILFNDTALVCQPAYEREQEDIASCTVATAQNCGWIWDIGLSTRRGVGHVYSSAHANDALVEKNLRDYLLKTMPSTKVEQLGLRKLRFSPGHRKVFWQGNCVAVGIAAGFIEPLEATALALVELSANMISEQLPATRDAMSIVAGRFNRRFIEHWERIVEFLKLHYVLSKRGDVLSKRSDVLSKRDYWQDHRKAASVPDSLQELLAIWEHKTPSETDIPLRDMFPWASYQYVLYGMGFETVRGSAVRRQESADRELAGRKFTDVASKVTLCRKSLMSNRELLQVLQANQFQVL